MKALVGTSNPSKLAEMRAMMEKAGIEACSPAELQLTADTQEDERTAQGNALQKALAWHRASGLPVFTEDSGLLLLELPPNHPDQPGVRVRRAPGYAMDDEQMLAYYQALAHRHGGQLRAAYQNAWCFLRDEKHYALYVDDAAIMARHAFLLTDKPCTERHPGWPLDSLSICPANGCYYAEMSDKAFAEVRRQENEEDDTARLIDWLSEQVKAE